jgi:chemotaxis protein methyltransferase CheR
MPTQTAIGEVLSRQTFQCLARRITHMTGIQMPPSKREMVQARLQRSVREAGLESVEAYAQHLASPQASEEELVRLINAVTTNKTDFFRENSHFVQLRNQILPEWSDRIDRGDRMTAWSAACSTGEEPYTLAMTLAQHADTTPGFRFRILATDISTRVLEQARLGIYTREQARDIPRELRARFLLAGQGADSHLVRMAPELRASVAFHRMNLMDANYPLQARFDVIFCRNVFIYFDRQTQVEVVDKLCRHLHRGGYLFIGHSETLAGASLPLVPLGDACYQKVAD